MLHGSITASITPFLPNGDLDLESFKKLVHFQIDHGSQGILIAGTTGESPTLTDEEWNILTSTAVKEARGRIPVIAGAGTYNTKESVEKAKAAKEMGADAALAVFPYYNRPGFHGCHAHFSAIAGAGLPVLVYYHPGRTGVNLSTEELSEICNIPGVIALKDCSAKAAYGLEVKSKIQKPLFCGVDPLIMAYLEGGGDGVVGVLSNLLPAHWSALIEAGVKGDLKTAQKLYQEIAPLCDALELEVNPQCIKYAMSLMGYCSPTYRLPLLAPQPETCKKIEEALELCKQVIAYA